MKKGDKMSEESKRKMSIAKTGTKNPKTAREKHHNWKGGKGKTTQGYVCVFKPNHPFNVSKYVLEHRLVTEKQIGRYLKPTEIVHHINKKRDDNRIENLMVFKNKTYHQWFHRKGYCTLKGIIFDGRDLQNNKDLK